LLSKEKKREIVIGDIHGCYKTFNKLIFCILEISKEDNIYLLGDYIDRGPNSKEVIDLILTLQEEGYHFYPIMGNHEKLLIDSLYSTESFLDWIENGCLKTLNSFGIVRVYDLEEKYINFFSNLPYFIKLDKYVLVHGGINLSIEDPYQDTNSMVWIRTETGDIEKKLGRRVIAGHTPLPIDEIKKSLDKPKIYLDGGCVYYKRYKGLGNLCALDLNKMELYYLTNIDE
jgi:serine/threonine protein phosphatase 1